MTLIVTEQIIHSLYGYSGIMDTNNFEYSFNPCNPFTTVGDSGECTNVHVCQKTLSEPVQIQDIEMWINGSKPYIYYTGPGLREVFVLLECDTGVTAPVITTTGDTKEPFTYEITFTLCHACIGGCAAAGGSIAAGIPGLVLILLLCIGVTGYCILGGIVMKVRFKKSGTDTIPHKEFWCSLPGLIKGGFVFIFLHPLTKLAHRLQAKHLNFELF